MFFCEFEYAELGQPQPRQAQGVHVQLPEPEIDARKKSDDVRILSKVPAL